MPPPRDITRDFTIAASALATGELIKDEFFTLAESVGALEIMDAKMDSGFLEPGETLEAEYDFTQPLSAAQAIGMMDQLLSLETAWQQGHALAQTVFTCLYIDKMLWPVPRILSEATFHRGFDRGRAGDVVDVILRAYCCAVVKTCDLIQAQVTSEQYYEEEDFSGHLYRRELLSRTPTPEVVELLNSAEASVECMPNIDSSLKQAIIQRLQFRQKLLIALIAEIPRDRDKACTAWATCHELLNKVRESYELGVSVPQAFSHKVQRKLASSTPPRPIVEVSFAKTFEHMLRMCVDTQEAFSVLDCATGLGIVTFLVTYMSKRPQPSVYVRCLMQTIVYKDGLFLGKMSHQDMIFRDLNELIVGKNIITEGPRKAAEAPQTATSEISSSMHTFAEATSHSFADLVRCLCMNRSRTRRMLSHTLNDWENLQFEAEDVDVRLREHTGERPLIDRLSAGEEIWSYPLSSWVYTYKLKQMEWIIQLGFELNVYLPAELASMYWYLRYLAETRIQHLSRIRTFAKRALDLDRKPTTKKVDAFKHTFAVLDFAVAEATATASFAEALCSLYQALRLAQLIPQSPRPYGTDEFRYNLRVKPFLTVSLPPVPSREDLSDALEGKMQNLSIKNEGQYAKSLMLLASADELTKIAKKEWDALSKEPAETAQCVGCEDSWRRKAKDVVKSVISTGIGIAGATRAISKAGDNPIEGVSVEIPELGYHEWWLVPAVKSK